MGSAAGGMQATLGRPWGGAYGLGDGTGEVSSVTCITERHTRWLLEGDIAEFSPCNISLGLKRPRDELLEMVTRERTGATRTSASIVGLGRCLLPHSSGPSRSESMPSSVGTRNENFHHDYDRVTADDWADLQ